MRDCHRNPGRRTRAAFSLTELVIVIVILGVIAAVAVPRFSVAVENARASALLADSAALQTAIEHYAAEHLGHTPAHNADGTIVADASLFSRRLLERTDHAGTPGAGIYGPYLRSMPSNSVNGRLSVRIGGADAGDNTAGWHFDPDTLEIAADDSEESAEATKSGTKTAEFIARARR